MRNTVKIKYNKTILEHYNRSTVNLYANAGANSNADIFD